jgi:glutathione S-transferase
LCGQLPYLLDDDRKIGDSDAIVMHLIQTMRLEAAGI